MSPHTDVEERSDTASGQSGAVTVASNLPDGDAAGGGTNTSQASESRERVNYEVSQTEHSIERGPGDIKRLTVAVVVNKLTVTDPDGTVRYQDRPDQELADLEDLVASAVGYDEARGDQITLRAMELPEAGPAGTTAAASFLDRFPLDVMSLIQMAVLAAVILALVFFLLRPLLLRPPQVDALPAPAEGTDQSPLDGVAALTGEIADETGDFVPASAPPALSHDAPDLTAVDRLRGMIGERQEESVEILRSWLEEKGENA